MSLLYCFHGYPQVPDRFQPEPESDSGQFLMPLHSTPKLVEISLFYLLRFPEELELDIFRVRLENAIPII